jgi:hypothetical protein
MRGLALDPPLVAALQAQLPGVAETTVRTITAEVPEYADAFAGETGGEMGATITEAVRMALAGFLRTAARPTDDDTRLGAAREGAYALGRGEARSGRTADALLAAYRIGARVSWRDWSATAVEHGVTAAQLAPFAELVFAYIDELSAASVAGHSDELATSGRVREQYRERLGLALLTGGSTDALEARAQRADWPLPTTLTAVLVAPGRSRDSVTALDPRTLVVPGDVVDLDDVDVLLVPDARRSLLLRALRGRPAVVGPARPWTAASASYRRALRLQHLLAGATGPLDTDAHLVELVLTADPDALADLRAAALAPLADLRPGAADRLAETLRSWLLHQGRREEVAADLHVHPQTVRYRMTQLRELLGDRLTDPEHVLRLTVALGLAGAAERA